MDRLEKVELVREKCGVSYEEARDALEACGYDVLDAIVKLEREGKTAAQTACYATESERRHEVSPAMQVAQKQYEEQSRKTKFGELWEAFWKQVKRFIRATLDMTFVAEREGERVVGIPVLFMILGIFLWGATIWLLIIGLFFGFKYHIEGANPFTVDVNDAMDKVADAAENLKRDFTKDE